MPHYVYIIESLKDGTFYKGYSSHPLLRLQQHNNQDSKFTANHIPWKLVYVEEFTIKKDALIREKNLKKATNERIAQLLIHAKNIVHQFIDR